MSIAHLPAGYLITHRIARRRSPALLALGLVASALPAALLLLGRRPPGPPCVTRPKERGQQAEEEEASQGAEEGAASES
jgi:hypothetical protein